MVSDPAEHEKRVRARSIASASTTMKTFNPIIRKRNIGSRAMVSIVDVTVATVASIVIAVTNITLKYPVEIMSQFPM